MKDARPDAFGAAQNFSTHQSPTEHEEETHPKVPAEFAKSWSGATVARSRAPSFVD